MIFASPGGISGLQESVGRSEEGLARNPGRVVFCGVLIMQARMAKLVDAPDLGSGGAIRAGSSPVPGIF